MSTLHASILSLCNHDASRMLFQLQRESGGYRSVNRKTYKENALRLSTFLQKQGVGKGDSVLIVSENGPEWTMAALAAMNLGAVVVPVASIASFLEIENILREAKPKFCFISTRCTAARQLEAQHDLPHLVWDLQSAYPLQDFIGGLEPLALNTTIDENAPAILIFTSGTTGHPKAVPLSHKNILTNARDAIAEIEANHKDRLVSVLPLSHMFEFTGGFVTAMLIEAQVTYVKSLRADDLMKAMKDTKATIMLGVPLLFEIIARSLQTKMAEAPLGLKHVFAGFEKVVRQKPSLGKTLFFPIHRALGGKLRYFMAGGSRLQPAVYDFFRGLGITVLQGYGLTETSPVLSVTNLTNSAPDHVGRALRSIEVGIFNDKGEKLPLGVEGEIWARGPSIFKGYKDPSHNKDIFFGEWFRTGDLGTLDSAGLLRITGRKKDIIVTSAGKNVYPEEIESVVFASGKFLEVSVLGINDGAGHEKICLVLVPDKSKFLGLAKVDTIKKATDIAMEICKTLSDYKWPQKVEVLFEELPKTITRKVKKHELRKVLANQAQSAEKAAAAAARPGNALNLDDELERTLAESIAAITKQPASEIVRDAVLTKDIGLDSLTFVEVVSSVEKTFSMQLEGIDFAGINTVADLLAALQLQLGSKRRRKKIFSKVFFADFYPMNNQRLCWSIPRRFMNVSLRAYLRIRHRIEVYGLENLYESKGSLVFAPNHTSHFDTMSIMGSIPGHAIHRTFAVAAKDYFFNKSWKALFSRVFINAMPFDRKGRVDESMAKCREILGQGGSLVIFPEGTRSPDGQIQDFKSGVGRLLAGHRRACGVPVYIDGAFGIMPKGSGFPRNGKLRVFYGKPISFQDLKAGPESYRTIAEALHKEVLALQAEARKH